MTLQLRTLEYLKAVYEYKNFTKAAEELYVSQPTISAAINRLEKEIGVRLIIRSPKKVIFTPEGELFIQRARSIINDLHTLQIDMLEFSKTRKKVLRIGISPAIPPLYMKSLYTNFIPSLSKYESAIIDEGGAYEHFDKLLNDHLDIAFTAIPNDIKKEHFHTLPVTNVEVCLLAREDHPLAMMNSIPFEIIKDYPIISLDNTSFIAHVLRDECQKRKINLELSCTHLHLRSYIEEIQISNKLGLIAKNSLKNLNVNHNMVLLSFSEAIFVDLGLIYLKNSSKKQTMFKFIKFIENSLNSNS